MKRKMKKHSKKIYYAIFAYLILSQSAFAATNPEDSIVGKVLSWITGLFGIIYELIVTVGAVCGFVYMLLGLFDKIKEGRNEEGWLKKVSLGFVICAVCAGLVGATLDDTGVNDGGKSLQLNDWGSSSNTGS
jgi:choline-glycine betaine transporter